MLGRQKTCPLIHRCNPAVRCHRASSCLGRSLSRDGTSIGSRFPVQRVYPFISRVGLVTNSTFPTQLRSEFSPINPQVLHATDFLYVSSPDGCSLSSNQAPKNTGLILAQRRLEEAKNRREITNRRGVISRKHRFSLSMSSARCCDSLYLLQAAQWKCLLVGFVLHWLLVLVRVLCTDFIYHFL